jgi:hypothetical protein
MRSVKRLLLLAAVLAPVSYVPAVAADESKQQRFVEANILSIFYHELGHALIDLLEVPIFGQEEDAADVMSVLLIDWLFEEASAQDMAHASAFGYINDPDHTEEVLYWDLHGPDEQRYYNHVCLFYGANPDQREQLADDLGLPPERAESCPEEYEQAAAAWGAVFDEMEAEADHKPLKFVAGSGVESALPNAVLSAEVESMNAELALPETLTIKVQGCDEPNAYYDPTEVAITFCEEFIPHLEYLYDELLAD